MIIQLESRWRLWVQFLNVSTKCISYIIKYESAVSPYFLSNTNLCCILVKIIYPEVIHDIPLFIQAVVAEDLKMY